MNRDELKECFARLERVGFERPARWNDAAEAAKGIDEWVSVVADIDPQAFHDAIGEHIRTARGRWWPVPGQIVALIRSGPMYRVYDPEDDR